MKKLDCTTGVWKKNISHCFEQSSFKKRVFQKTVYCVIRRNVVKIRRYQTAIILNFAMKKNPFKLD